jgi:hypothetical protein
LDPTSRRILAAEACANAASNIWYYARYFKNEVKEWIDARRKNIFNVSFAIISDYEVDHLMSLLQSILHHSTDEQLKTATSDLSRLRYTKDYVKILKVVLDEPRMDKQTLINRVLKHFCIPPPGTALRTLDEFKALQSVLNQDISKYVEYHIFDSASIELSFYIVSALKQDQ